MKKLIMTVMTMAVMAMAVSVYAEDKTVTHPRPVIIEKKAESIVNINAAESLELQSLEGVGKKLAVRIIEHRTANGEFKTIENLMDVKGIGKAIFELNKDRLTVK